MANGMTRIAQANIILKKKLGKEEMNEEMARLNKVKIPPFPLKAGKK